jgi:hypothetical protein
VALLVDAMPEPKSNERGRGRPKGTGRGVLGASFAVRISPEYKVWMTEFARVEKAEMADLFREGMRIMADQRGFRRPPLK